MHEAFNVPVYIEHLTNTQQQQHHNHNHNHNQPYRSHIEYKTYKSNQAPTEKALHTIYIPFHCHTTDTRIPFAQTKLNSLFINWLTHADNHRDIRDMIRNTKQEIAYDNPDDDDDNPNPQQQQQQQRQGTSASSLPSTDPKTQSFEVMYQSFKNSIAKVDVVADLPRNTIPTSHLTSKKKHHHHTYKGPTRKIKTESCCCSCCSCSRLKRQIKRRRSQFIC